MKVLGSLGIPHPAWSLEKAYALRFLEFGQEEGLKVTCEKSKIGTGKEFRVGGLPCFWDRMASMVRLKHQNPPQRV